jgi:hypothetical protein
MASFCCGLGDCTDAGAPGKRGLFSSAAATSAGHLILHDKNGNIIEPKTAALLQNAPLPEEEDNSTLQSRNAAPNALTKRDCDGFTATRAPYQSGGTNHIISDVVTCSATQGCSATIGQEVTETTSFSAEVSISDPLGIVSASVGFSFEKSVTQSFSGTWEFGPGERGYVVFIPYIT